MLLLSHADDGLVLRLSSLLKLPIPQPRVRVGPEIWTLLWDCSRMLKRLVKSHFNSWECCFWMLFTPTCMIIMSRIFIIWNLISNVLYCSTREKESVSSVDSHISDYWVTNNEHWWGSLHWLMEAVRVVSSSAGHRPVMAVVRWIWCCVLKDWLILSCSKFNVFEF